MSNKLKTIGLLFLGVITVVCVILMVYAFKGIDQNTSVVSGLSIFLGFLSAGIIIGFGIYGGKLVLEDMKDGWSRLTEKFETFYEKKMDAMREKIANATEPFTKAKLQAEFEYLKAERAAEKANREMLAREQIKSVKRLTRTPEEIEQFNVELGTKGDRRWYDYFTNMKYDRGITNYDQMKDAYKTEFGDDMPVEARDVFNRIGH